MMMNDIGEVQRLIAKWQKENGIRVIDNIDLKYMGFPGSNTREKMMGMNRGDHISKQSAINAIENTECKLTARDWNEITDAIMNIPAEDIVKVIRCKDCVNWDTDWETHSGGHYCPMIDLSTRAEFFCGYGEMNKVGEI